MEERWENIKKMVKDNEIDHVVQLCNEMEINEAEVLKQKLIREISETDDVCYRNTIAIILGDLKCDKAMDILFELILNPNNINCRGTLIYALRELSCEHRLSRLMYIIADGNYEVRWMVQELLLEKIESMNESDKSDCINVLMEERDRLREATECLEDILDNIFMCQ